jgi:hypothetical protein
VRDPKRLPSIEPTLQCTSRRLSEGRAISQALPPGFALRPSFRERLHGSRASPRLPDLPFERVGSFGQTSSIDFCSYDTLVDTTLIESSDLAPIASLFEREPEPTFVKATYATLSRSAPSRSRMTGPVCATHGR